MNHTVLFEASQLSFTSLCGNAHVPLNNALTGLKYFNNETFATVSRWRAGVPSTLNKVVADEATGAPVLQPWPSCAWQEPGNPAALQFVQSMEIDSRGRMWVIDVGRRNIMDPSNPPINDVPPKLVIFDVATQEMLSSYTFPDAVAAHNASFLNDIVVDGVNGFAYISEAGTGAIVVYDHSDPVKPRSRRFAGASTQNDPTLHWVIEGVDYGTGNFTIPEDGIALTPDTKTLYYNALQGLQLYSVPTACLRVFPAAGEPEPCAGSGLITDHGAKPSPMDGMSFSDNGKLYFGGLMKSALYEWDPATPLAQATQKASGSRDLQWPDTFAWDGRGNILFTTNKLQRYFTNTIDTSGEPNYRIVSVPVGGGSYINGPK